MPEGSVIVDGFDAELEDQDQDTQQINNQDDPQSDSQDLGENQDESQDENQDGGNGVSKTTDHGTKLDPNPMSAINQQLANARRDKELYEALLSDPKQVRAYLSQLEEEMGVEDQGADKGKPTEERIKAEDIKTRDDLVKFAKQLEEDSDAKVSKLAQYLQSMQGQEKVKQTLDQISNEIKAVQEKYPQLREKNADGSQNPDHDPALESMVGDFFLAFNYDQKKDEMYNNVPMRAIADTVMQAYQLGQKSGSTRTNTQIIDKRTGRTKSDRGGQGGQQIDESKMSAAQAIASRIKRARANQR